MEEIYVFDIGTNNTVCSVYCVKSGVGKVLPNAEGKDHTPSAVIVGPTPQTSLVGRRALERAMLDSGVLSFKSYLNQGDVITTKEGVTCNIKEVLLAFFYHLKETYDVGNKKVILCYPSYFSEDFNNERENMLIDAANRAGLNVWGTVEEPVAAAFGYIDFDKMTDKPTYYRVVDCGAGTYDIAIIEVSNKQLRVIKTFGDLIGGDNLDYALMDECIIQLKQQGANVLDDMLSMQRLRTVVEECKVAFSTIAYKKNDNYDLDFYVDKYHKHFTLSISKKKYYDKICKNLWLQMAQLLNKVDTFECENEIKIDTHLLVGGTHCESYFVEEYKKRYQNHSGTITPFLQRQAVASGGAVYAHMLATNDPRVKMTIGIRTKISKNEYCIHNYIFRDQDLFSSQTFTVYTDYFNQERIALKIYASNAVEEKIMEHVGKHIATYYIDISESLKARSPIRVTFRMRAPGLLELRAIAVESDERLKETVVLQKAS